VTQLIPGRINASGVICLATSVDSQRIHSKMALWWAHQAQLAGHIPTGRPRPPRKRSSG